MKRLKYYFENIRISKALLLLLLTILAFIVRTRGLTNNSLWNDELWTVYFSSTRHLKTVWEMLQIISTKLAENPPLYPIIMRIWIYFFGDGEISIRFPSVIFGSLSIPLFYMCLKQIVNKKISIISSILLLFSPIHIHYSQEARTYALFFLLSLLSMYFFFKLNSNFLKRYVIGYIFTTILLLYSHYYALFLFFGQIILSFFIHENRKKWLLIYFCILFLFIPWLPSFMHHASSLKTGSWVNTISIKEGLVSEVNFFTPSLPSFQIKIIFQLLFLIGLIKNIVAARHNRYIILVLLTWLLIPVLIPLILSQYSKPFFVNRFALISLAPFLVFVSMGIELLIKLHKIFFLPLMFIVYFTILSSQSIPQNVSVENWRTVTSFLEDSKSPIMLYPETPATKMGIEYYSKGEKIDLISYENFNSQSKNCFQKIYLISRFNLKNINSNCMYILTKTLFPEKPPYLYEFQSSSDFQNLNDK